MAPRGKDIHTVQNQDGKWVNKQDGQQIGPAHSTQEKAIDQGRDLAKVSRVDHSIHGRDGKIREKNSYGPDKFPPKG